jgi:UDP-N-acetylglucosamine--N-acetylmuramyl-(pentapeptide) pyrophosphoryl-undecaprenol N-acetylglucosamine transferase
MSRHTLRILFTGGGTGGHIYPILAVAEELRKIAEEKEIVLDLYYLGPKDSYSQLLRGVDIQTRNLIAGKIRRYITPLSILQNIFDVVRFVLGSIQTFFKVFWIMPDVIFSKGGTGSFPVVFVGWFYRIPILIHESDVTPGMNNLLSSRFAFRIAVSFERTLSYFHPQKTACVGNPIQEERTAHLVGQETAKKELGFDPGLPLILVLGGSQGSQRMNDFILLNLNSLLEEAQVLHQTGWAHFKTVEKLSRAAILNLSVHAATHRYLPMAYLTNEYSKALEAADIVIARGGSGTIFEIAAFKKPAILIPLLESANDHQRANAYEFAKTGAAIVIEEGNLLPGIFLNQIKTILHTPGMLDKMKEASDRFATRDAARSIAEEILGIAWKKG